RVRAARPAGGGRPASAGCGAADPRAGGFAAGGLKPGEPMITLGINAAFHDSAAALVVDGETVAAAEEERFTRIKHAKRPLPFSAWELPFHAIDYCLGEVGATLAEVDHVAYSFEPEAFMADWPQEAGTIEPPLEPGRPAPA